MIQVDNFADFWENYIQLDHIVDELGKDSIVVDCIHVVHIMKVTTDKATQSTAKLLLNLDSLV